MDQPPPTPEPPPDAPKPPAMSLLARLMNVFAAPGEVFAEVRISPPSTLNWVAPALVFIVANWVGAWLIFSQDSVRQQVSEIKDQAIEKRIEQAKMSKEDAEAARQMGEKWGNIATNIAVVAGPVLGAMITPFWWGLILWLGSKVLKGRCGFMKAVEVAGLANMIGVLETIVKTLLIVSLGNIFASPSLALLVKEFNPQNPTHSLLAVANLMTLWALAVRSVGLARLIGASFGKAALWVFGLWAAYTGLTVGFGFAMHAAFGR